MENTDTDLADLLDIDPKNKKEAEYFIKMGSKNLYKMCRTNKEKRSCTKILNFWKEQYGNAQVTVIDTQNGTSKTESREEDYPKHCRNIMAINAFKKEYPNLDIEYIANYISDLYATPTLEKQVEETFQDRVHSGYCLHKAEGMLITNIYGTPIDPFFIRPNGKKDTPTAEMIHDAKLYQPR